MRRRQIYKNKTSSVTINWSFENLSNVIIDRGLVNLSRQVGGTTIETVIINLGSNIPAGGKTNGTCTVTQATGQWVKDSDAIHSDPMGLKISFSSLNYVTTVMVSGQLNMYANW